MAQLASGLFVIGWKVVLALVAGSSALTAVCVYLLARFTNAFDLYAGEHAKFLAQFQNLDKLVHQTEKLTEATETIKAQVSDEHWDRQQRWLKRAECYTGVVEKLHAYTISATALRAASYGLALHAGSHDEEPYLVLIKKRDEAFDGYNDCIAEWVHVRNAACLVSGAEPYNILADFELPDLGPSLPDPVMMGDILKRSAMEAGALSARFVSAARTDLKYEGIAVPHRLHPSKRV